MDTKIVGRNSGKVAVIVPVVGDWFRIDMDSKTIETMIYGFSNARRKARKYVK